MTAPLLILSALAGLCASFALCYLLARKGARWQMEE